MKFGKKVCLLLCLSVIMLTGCGGSESAGTSSENEFANIQSVCELATLKCYYHNVAQYSNDATGIWAMLGNIGYKKLWIEYSGIVELGIDVNKVEISPADADGVVQITIPEAEVLSVSFDTESITAPLTETGLFTEITADDKTEAFAAAQEEMESTARADEALLLQAQERAKNILEGYVRNVGEELGREYTVEWVEAEEGSDE